MLNNASDVPAPVKDNVASASGSTNVHSEPFNVPVWKSSDTIVDGGGGGVTCRIAALLVTGPDAFDTMQRKVAPLSPSTVAGVV